MPLISYLPQVATSAVLMSVCYGMGRLNYSSLWLFLFVGLSFMKNKMWKAKQKREIALQIAARHEKELVMAELENTLQDLPAWVQFPDVERVEWINKLVLQLWPYIGDYVKVFINEKILPVVRQNLPGPLQSFRFVSMDMGDIPVRLGGIKVYTENVGRDKIIMDMDVAYMGDCEFVVAVGGFQAGMNNLQFKGKLRAIMKPLVAKPPLVGGVTAHFLDNPTIDFNLTGLGEAVEMPGLFSILLSIVRDQVGKICVLPNSITIPIMPDVDPVKLYFPEPEGVARIRVVEAKNLENRDMTFLKKGKSDPYCEIAVGAQTFRTKVIDDNLNPFWGEVFEAVVDTSYGQRIQCELFDKDLGDNDEELGRAVIDLDAVKQSGLTDRWFPLENAKHGDLHLQIMWLTLSSDPMFLSAKQQWETAWNTKDITPAVAIVMVFVDSVANLPSPKRDLEPSPYVQVTLNNETQKTYVKPKTRHPVYQKRFLFLADNPEHQRLEVRARHDGNNRDLGEFVYPLKQLFRQPKMEAYQQTFPLQQGAHTSQLVMTLRLRALTSGIAHKG